MPSTNQTDLAGREWRTTPERRAEMRKMGSPHLNAALEDLATAVGLFRESEARVEQLKSERVGLRLDLETALAKIEALEAERKQFCRSIDLALHEGEADEEPPTPEQVIQYAHDARERGDAAEARAAVLGRALRPFAKIGACTLLQYKRDDETTLVAMGDLRRAALLNPDPAEQPEAGR